MKKVLLTSAAVLAVFAAAAPAFANNEGNVHTGNLDNKTEVTGKDFFSNETDGLTQAAKDGLNNVDADSTKQKFEAGEHIEPKRDANGNIIKDEFVVTDKANANKDAKEEAKAVKAAEKKAPAAAKADAKALPNTAAVK